MEEEILFLTVFVSYLARLKMQIKNSSIMYASPQAWVIQKSNYN